MNLNLICNTINPEMHFYYPTFLLKNLNQKNLLDDRLACIFPEESSFNSLFLKTIWSKGKFSPDESNLKYIPKLLDYGLTTDTVWRQNQETGSLLFVKAINFELTYKCQYLCPHCWQSDKRTKIEQELSTDKIKDTIFRAFIGGLCKDGINFTGGEVIGNRDDLFEILEYTNSLKIPFRINSNSWWATKRDLNICKISFSSPYDLVVYLKSIGLKMFAFSFDERYKEDRQDISNLIESIKLC